MNPEQDQVERVLEHREGEPPEHDDGESPIMPFPTCYVLSRHAENGLIDHAFKRMGTLRSEVGRDVCENGEWWNKDGGASTDPEGLDGPERSWMGKRFLYEKLYRNDVDWRPAVLGGIFGKSNLVIPAARRICRQMIARATNYFFGTNPWFAVYPVGTMDRDRAKKADRYARWKMDQTKLQRIEEKAVEQAFVVGEAVIKTTWRNRGKIYKTKVEVLVDADSKPIMGGDGDYITKRDTWVTDSAIDPVTNLEVMGTLAVLSRDRLTPQPAVMKFVLTLITRRITHYKGPEAAIVNPLDFLCPLQATSIEEADIVIHLYDKPLMELADEWKQAIEAGASAEDRLHATQMAIQLLRRIAGSGRNTQSGGAIDPNAGGSGSNDKTQPILQIAEFHLRYDADGDGMMEDVMLICDVKTRTPIFYDYLPNVTPDGLRPFSCVRVNEVLGRWYGVGAMEMFESSQKIIDLWINRKNFANSSAARVDFWQPENTIEGRSNEDLTLNWGQTYTPLSGKKASDCLESIYLENNVGDDLQLMIEFFMQLMMNESGIANANDGNSAGMDSAKLATGIRNIEKSGQELFSLFLGHLEPGIAESLGKMIKILFARMDEMEVHRYFEDGEAGGEGAGDLLAIDPGDLANLEIDTRVLLTRYRGEQVIESNLAAWKIAVEYHNLGLASPEMQQRLRTLADDVLDAYQIQNSHTITEPLTMPGLPAPGSSINPQQAAQAGAPKVRQAPPSL